MPRVAVLACFVGLLSLWAPAAADGLLEHPTTSELADALVRYEADRRALERLHDAPGSPARRAALRAYFDAARAELETLDFDALSRAGQVDWLLLANRLRYEQRRLDLDELETAALAPLVPFEGTIVALAEARRRMEPVDPRAAAGKVAQLADAVEALCAEEHDEEADDRSLARKAAQRVRELSGALRDWFRFHDGYDPPFGWWVRAPHERADAALEKWRETLEKRAGTDDAEAIVGEPLGRAALLAELALEMIPYAPEELVAIGERELAWCEGEMVRAARELGYGDDWRAALEHVKGLHVPPGEQPELIRTLALEAVAFLEEHELVTIPELCESVWRMEMMSPERQKVTPFFTGGEVVRVAYPTDSMSHESKLMSMRGNNVHFSRAVVHHELIPGHHLQGFQAARHNVHRRPFGTPFYGEGWALYWELRLWDLDFARGPEDRVGMLFWRMHRCARVIESLRFHLGERSPQEMIDALVERVGHERDGATGEVRRWVAGDYGPLYQCAYLLGGLQLRALHAELVEAGTLTERAFHDAVLRTSSVPIELVRASLTDVPLAPDARSTWRFDG